MDDIDFKSRPIVLLVGQYSVGKTSFIRYLLNRDFPGKILFVFNERAFT